MRNFIIFVSLYNNVYMKVICVGWNYPKHNAELGGAERPTVPTIFCKPDSALLKENKDFYIPDFSEQVDYEVEVVVRINRLGKSVAEKFAPRYYAQVALGIDFTARDMQNEARATGAPWDLCKGFDGSAVVSEFRDLETIGTINDLNFRLEINGETVQSANTSEMIFSVDEIITYVSQFYTLKIGDLIYTGTPDGVGPVKRGDRLKGYLQDELLLDFEIK
jgi:2-keto-4-pentenoate hydratase/2-oxohepta-3-ene-1,7-dioic acid hydratase in catechol pathway